MLDVAQAQSGIGLDTITSVVFPVLTVIIGGACILLFSVTTTLRASNSDLRERVRDLEAKEARSEVTITGQAAEIEALRKVVTGEVHLVAITDLLTEHHAEAVKIWKSWDQRLNHFDTALVALVEAQTKGQET